MKHFLDLSQIDKKELRNIIEEAKRRKKKYSAKTKVLVTEKSNAKNISNISIFNIYEKQFYTFKF